MSEDPVLEAPTAAKIRDELEDLVVHDLYGPTDDAEEEFRSERPTDRYLLGRLAPAGTIVEPDEFDDDPLGKKGDFGESQEQDQTAPNIASLSPSALGCTMYVAGATTELTVRASWARYDRMHPEGSEHSGLVWRRVPMHGTASISLREGDLGPHELSTEPKVVIRGRARSHDGNWLVSLFLVNATPKSTSAADRAWLFQVRFSVEALERAPAFLPRPVSVRGGDASDQAEQRRLAMAYRFCPEFAVGHGTAVHVEPASDTPMRAVEIRTVAVPSYELPFTDVPDPRTDPDLPELGDVVLDMKVLSELTKADVIAGLVPLVAGYRAWIERQNASVDDAARHLDGFEPAASSSVEAAKTAADRIAQGIDMLRDDDNAFKAFQFANQAMYLQRLRSLAAAARRKDSSLPPKEALARFERPEDHSWRPFQLAFVLLNLPSLARPDHPERADGTSAMADLLWFPTGGGKTEAYLGLTAFTLAIRRLSEPFGGYDPTSGVAVLMRYTLRLLTLQQFQRATALICACEVLRQADVTTWGRTPFRIGLWVGLRVTPNRTNDAADWLKQQRRTRGAPPRALGSPHQLTSCPWCGTGLEPGRDIQVDLTVRRTRVFCPDPFCVFSQSMDPEGIPIVVVDEELYRLLPSLVIATVDKFAQLPWRGETQALFGRVTERCTRHGYVTADLLAQDWELTGPGSKHQAKGNEPTAHLEQITRLRPPDLIIQDELHLISGPLGSLVGLYETAVDRLATWELQRDHRVRPKVIASTATVRRAERQIGSLFDRRTRVFPPPGIDIGDTYFARQRATTEHPGRRYVGLCAHGNRLKSTLIRVYVAVLGAAQKLHEKYGKNEITDPYMTLVGYFNSLRDLGGMRRLVEDDVSTRLARADDRGLARRYDPFPQELTSRLSSADIPNVLDHLEVPFKAKRSKGERPPIDVLLATNMIAVGVDVARLGVMVVANQPKSSAEYIQATSRVGRSAPGLVFTVFNWARPRDLSHYETFEQFHATIYQHVEALSVTPFAERAIDRGLTGVLLALVRDLESTYNGNLQAGRFDRNSELADHVVRYLKRRAFDIGADRKTSSEAENHLDARLDHWDRQRKIPGRRLVYNRKVAGLSDDAAGLLRGPDDGGWRLMTCPTSLRDVEPGIRLLLLPVGDDLAITEEPAFVPYDPPQEEPS